MDFDDAEEELDLGSGGRKAAAPPARYRECLKNHAVGIGGHAVDGCGEFMPAGEDGSLDALRCAACGCHRNFHHKELQADGPAAAAAAAYQYHHHHPPGPGQFSPYYRTPAGYLHQHAPAAARALAAPLALPSTSGEELSDPGSGSGRKRFRTKFSQEQKEKMLAFAERVGWRIQKQDEEAVRSFCEEAMVKRQVLKVWMHKTSTLSVRSPCCSLPLSTPARASSFLLSFLGKIRVRVRASEI
ncbi:ZF-HD protein dimerization region containing protein [Iris pallida]|uniref:ZF-HD protein dimerization region containing protein n=1 Tax=Iris pallida TaxID=29817 RepID=A0AAX6HJA1_IRIPA|nr:ZF-HD protein dimerization region containing protein [Iris pallida]